MPIRGAREEIEALAASLEEKIAAVDALIKNGKSLEEMKKAFGIESEPSRTGSRRLSLVEVIYLVSRLANLFPKSSAETGHFHGGVKLPPRRFASLR